LLSTQLPLVVESPSLDRFLLVLFGLVGTVRVAAVAAVGAGSEDGALLPPPAVETMAADGATVGAAAAAALRPE